LAVTNSEVKDFLNLVYRDEPFLAEARRRM